LPVGVGYPADDGCDGFDGYRLVGGDSHWRPDSRDEGDDHVTTKVCYLSPTLPRARACRTLER
jgi:hypothetical protein